MAEHGADGTGGCQGWRACAPPEGLVLDSRTARRHTDSKGQPLTSITDALPACGRVRGEGQPQGKAPSARSLKTLRDPRNKPLMGWRPVLPLTPSLSPTPSRPGGEVSLVDGPRASGRGRRQA